MKRLFAFVLTLVMSVSMLSVPVSAKSDRLGNYDHEIVDFKSIEYEHYDSSELEKKINDLSELCQDVKNLDTVKETVGWIIEEFYNFSDMRTIADYYFSKNSTSEYWNGESIYYNTEIARVKAINLTVLQEIIKSPCAEALKPYFTEEELDDISKSLPPTTEQLELQKKYLEILSEYYVLPDYIEYEGQNYTEGDLYNAFYAGQLSADQTNALIDELYYGRSEQTAELYLRLIEVNNTLAKTYGYDNYLDYAFENIYKRGYTPEEANTVCDSIYNKLINYFALLSNAYENSWINKISENALAVDKAELFGKYLEEIAPELKESYEYMMKTNSLDLLPDEGSVNSYTNGLYQYGMPFICTNGYSKSIYTFTTLVHEFGHYNSMYWRDMKHSIENRMDVEETFSLGLEMLYTRFYPEIYSEGGKSEEKRQVANRIVKMCDASAIAALEYAAYTGNYKTAKELSDAAIEIGSKFYATNGQRSVWYSIPHIFETPGYYISYAMSAINALEIYALSKENYEDAVDRYIKLIGNVNLPYEEAFEKSGLTSKWTEKKIEALFDKLIASLYDADAPVIEGVENGKVYTQNPIVTMSDEAGISMQLLNGDIEYYIQGREFTVAGSNEPYILTVTDIYGNTSSVEFSVDPYPFTVRAEAGSKQNTITWDQVPGAYYYVVYGASLGNKYKQLGAVDAVEQLEFNHKVKGKKTYKYYVLAITADAYTGEESIIAKSLKCYVSGADNKDKTDSVNIDIEGSDSLLIKNGEVISISVARTLKDDDETDIATGKIKPVRYRSTDENVAKVSKNGKIYAIGEGDCYIYAISENGLTDKVKVSVS